MEWMQRYYYYVSRYPHSKCLDACFRCFFFSFFFSNAFSPKLYKKMQAKEDPDWEKKVIAWIEGVLGEKLPSDELWVCLKNGLVLIRLLNAIKPGTVVKYNKTRLVPLLEMDNIHIFLKGCWTLGVPSECMFSTTELHKRQDMSKVMRNLEALSKIAPNFGIKVEPLDSSKKGLSFLVQWFRYAKNVLCSKLFQRKWNLWKAAKRRKTSAIPFKWLRICAMK